MLSCKMNIYPFNKLIMNILFPYNFRTIPHGLYKCAQNCYSYAVLHFSTLSVLKKYAYIMLNISVL